MGGATTGINGFVWAGDAGGDYPCAVHSGKTGEYDVHKDIAGTAVTDTTNLLRSRALDGRVLLELLVHLPNHVHLDPRI